MTSRLRAWLLGIVCACGGFGFFGCVNRAPSKAATPIPLLLISLDAFRWDYCQLHPAETPHLRRLMQIGSTAQSLIPIFPSNTFSNHYSIVTGLYPSQHGIINNQFFDRELGEMFYYNRPASVHDPRWWLGEPIWVTAARHGLVSATSFWVGSETLIHGMRPKFWKPYDLTIPFDTRLDEVIRWLRLPPGERPSFLTFYFEDANSVGHKFGPGSPELVATIKLLDERVGAIVQRLQTEGIVANLVIVSDHGITPISLERIILLDDYVDPAAVLLDFDGPVAGLRARDGNITALERAFIHLRHAKAYRTENLPRHFRVTPGPRHPDVWIVPDEGWEIYFRRRFEDYRTRFNRADHGYDPALPSMHGIFIAHGPSFRRGVKIPSLENIHVYNLLCAALGLNPAPNDGDDRLVKAALKN